MTRIALLLLAVATAPLAARAEKTFTSTRQGAWDCTKDPSVHILRGNGTYVFKGSCQEISIEGGNNQLMIEAVEALRIVGAHNTIDVGTIDTVHIIGAQNVVTWKRARSGDEPSVSAIGANNKVNRR